MRRIKSTKEKKEKVDCTILKFHYCISHGSNHSHECHMFYHINKKMFQAHEYDREAATDMILMMFFSLKIDCWVLEWSGPPPSDDHISLPCYIPSFHFMLAMGLGGSLGRSASGWRNSQNMPHAASPCLRLRWSSSLESLSGHQCTRMCTEGVWVGRVWSTEASWIYLTPLCMFNVWLTFVYDR